MYWLIFKEHSILFESASPSLAFGLNEMFDVEGEATMIFLKCMRASGYERYAYFEIFFYGALGFFLSEHFDYLQTFVNHLDLFWSEEILENCEHLWLCFGL